MGDEIKYTICPFTNKRRFETKADGRKMIQFARRNPTHHKQGRVEKRVVRCDGCEGYHMTSAARRT